MEFVVLIVVWILLSVLAARIAEKKGRSGGFYFLISFFLTPVIGLLMAAIATPDRAKAEELRVKTGAERKCPFCAELVKREAIVCRFCGKDLPPPPAPVYEAEGQRFKTREEYEAWKRKQADFFGP